MEVSTQVLWIPGYVPTSLNKSVGHHWSVKAKQKSGDRDLVAYYSREQGLIRADDATRGACPKRRVSFRVVWPKGQRMLDRDNILKAMFDALTHARLIV